MCECGRCVVSSEQTGYLEWGDSEDGVVSSVAQLPDSFIRSGVGLGVGLLAGEVQLAWECVV